MPDLAEVEDKQQALERKGKPLGKNIWSAVKKWIVDAWLPAVAQATGLLIVVITLGFWLECLKAGWLLAGLLMSRLGVPGH